VLRVPARSRQMANRQLVDGGEAELLLMRFG